MQIGWTLDATPEALLDAMGASAAVDRGLFAAGNVLQAHWQDHLSQPGTGVTYDVAFATLRTADGRPFVAPVGPRVPHTASAPGEPPAPDTGAARASIQVEDLPQDHTIRVGTDLEYLRYLRDGVQNHPGGITIEPRQVEPSIEPIRERMTREMRRELEAVGVRVAA